MKLQPIDIFIIALYLVAMIVIGLVLKKKASKNMDSYFLGGKTLPFYMLGLSNASGQFDISGTMWMVTLAFIYGVKSAWVPWLWPVFNQIFLMVYLSVWSRMDTDTLRKEPGLQFVAYNCCYLRPDRCIGLPELWLYRCR